MPFARVTLSGIGLTPLRREEFARRVAETMRDALGTPYRLTAVFVEELPVGSWTVGGQWRNGALLTSRRRSAQAPDR